MNRIRTLLSVICLAFLLLVSACDDEKIQTIINEARQAYVAGDYDRTIEILEASSQEILDRASLDQRKEVHKYTAFCYCLKKKVDLCRQNFCNILAIDPEYNLSPAERHHPDWGPVFEAAKTSDCGN